MFLRHAEETSKAGLAVNEDAKSFHVGRNLLFTRQAARTKTNQGGRNSRYRSADILVRLGLANVVEADKNVRAPVVFLHSRRKP
jgi:hypothetical protein